MHRKLTNQALVCGLLLSSCSLFSQSPGGVTRQSLWLQGNSFSGSTERVTLNFNPATTMGDISKGINMPGNIEELRRATIFTVYQRRGLQQELPVWQMNGGFGDILLSTRQLTSQNGKMNMVFEKKSASVPDAKPEAIISTYIRQGVPAASEDDADKDIVIHFGPASKPVGQSAGLIAEFIVYETILKEKDIAKIESYLALKYGVTLEKDYVNSLGQIIWNQKKEALYSNNIAGIGRDDLSTLHQKQGTSSSSSDQLAIGVTKIASANAANTGQLSNRDYLIWGDNGQPLLLSQNQEPGVDDILLSEKKWMIKSSGKTANAISTALEIDTKTLLPATFGKENFYLVIDPTGSGDFAPEKCTYLTPENISSDGIASFSGVHWDADGSGKDAFSFGLKTRLQAAVPTDAARLVSFHVYPNPVTENGRYTIAVTLDKPADLNIKVYDINLRLVDSKKVTGQANYLLPGNIKAAAGTYIIKLFTADREFSKFIIKH
ncbi:MAG: T9SS type A sorting domain-containing protein [Chitinophagaceae bacterium]